MPGNVICRSMNICVNGETLAVENPLTVRQLIVHLGLDKGPVAVERNMDVVPRKDHEATFLADGDTIEIVHFVGGG
jgi:thiamine biosynthesis protein ThiS